MICHVTAAATTQLDIKRAESRDLTCRGRKRVGSSGINFYCVGAVWSDFGVVWCEFLFVVRFGAVNLSVVRYRTKTWSLRPTNQSTIFWSRDIYQPIRAQYSSHVTHSSQSEHSILIVVKYVFLKNTYSNTHTYFFQNGTYFYATYFHVFLYTRIFT